MHWTLQPSPAITLAAYGNFTAPKAQEVAVVRGGGQWLALMRPNEHSGKMETIAEANVFGVIRCIAAFRLVGQLHAEALPRATHGAKLSAAPHARCGFERAPPRAMQSLAICTDVRCSLCLFL